MQLHPSGGQMGWRAAGDAPLSSPWPAPVVALPELLPCRAGWKTSSPGKPWSCSGSSWGEDGRSKSSWGFRALPSPLTLLHPSAVSRVFWDVPSAKPLALPCLQSIRCQAFFPRDLLSISGTQQFLWPPCSNADGIFGGVSPHLLQNGAFSFPYG